MCQIVEAHYFRGRHSAIVAEDKRQLFGDRQIDDILMSENIVTHYWSLRQTHLGGYEEKGIDVWLALEAYELAVLNKCDVVVLIVMDGDFVPLVRKIQALGIQVTLLYWEYSYQNKFEELKDTRVAVKLLRAVSHSICVSDEINNQGSDPIVNQLFVRQYDYENGNHEIPLAEAKTIEGGAAVQADGLPIETSTILSLKSGYGFIRNETGGNVFFHHSDLQNAEFDNLETNMPVRYTKMQADGRYNAS
ncbi:MAG: NYN domain-containing protein [Deferribacteraceae bacterium]|jgi:cold shock CspA family protein|nr:NYN domain-containing protein [Deferribacteraceae bacterium]